MKSKLFGKLFLIAVLFVSGCSSAATTPTASTGLGLDSAPWPNGETTNYTWLDDASSNQIGTSVITMTQQTANWIIQDRDVIGQLDQTFEMSINDQSLEPIGENKIIKSPGNDIQLTSVYSAGKVDIAATVNGSKKSASVDVPANTLDNDQLLMTLRALPFSEGYKVTYIILNTMSATKTNGVFTVQPQETVNVPAGSFNTWKVEMNFGQTTQQAWYAVDSPHQLIKYDNGTTQMVLSK
jgi:hypothetical protein